MTSNRFNARGFSFTRRPAATRTAAAVLLGAVLLGCVSNEPYPEEWIAQNTLFTSFQERPKYLDPVSSYSNNETPWTFQIYEPPLQYHYLKRPYVLEGRTAAALPEVRYLDKDGKPIGEDAPSEQVATSVYTVRLKPGTRFQPHPAFARDAFGAFLYQDLKPEDIAGRFSPWDFPLDKAATSTRELRAEDYVYQIKRLASPYVPTPSVLYGLMSLYVEGLKDLRTTLTKERTAALAQRPARDQYLPWRDLREVPFTGARAIDDLTFEIRVIGKYPQFRYWLAMTMFAPVAWEVDRFYAQRGMAENSLTMNAWPVGTGPFMLRTQSANRYVMERNPNFRGEAYPCEGMPGDRERGLLADCGKTMPFVNRVVSTIEKERQPEEAKLLQGYYDVPNIERLDQAFPLLKEQMDRTGRHELIRERGIQLPSSIEPTSWYMGFNMLDPVVGDGANPEQAARNRKLRQALSIATDWEEHYTVFFDTYGPALTAMGPIPPGLFGYRDGRAGINPVTHEWVDGQPKRRSIEAAKKLLAEAGYPNGRDEKTGQPLVLYYDSNGTGPAYQARLDWQVKQFRKLDIQLEIRSADYNRFQDRMRKGQAQIYFWGWNADYPDAENFLFLLYGPQGKVKHDGENASNYENAEFDRLYLRMKDLPDGPERQQVIDRMVEIVREDAVWMFGLFPGATGVYQPWLRNAKPSIINRDMIKYYRVDPAMRVQRIAEWNRPKWWPILAALAAFALVLVPARAIWRRRERATARTGLAVPREA